MKKGCEKARVKKIRIHDLRHSHVSLLIDLGFSAVEIADRMGHESVDMTYHYAHMFPSRQDEMANKLEIALDYLNRNYSHSDLKISEAAKMTGMSEKHFRRVFYGVYKKKPHEFLKDIRLNNAEQLLLNTSKPVSDIAIQCGFSDVYSFSHCFKRNFGISPKTYRKM